MSKNLPRFARQNLVSHFARNKLLVILGPTASGKSDLAIKIAKLFNGEIISADSRQVYKGMDIGTGKVPISYEPHSGEFTKLSILRSLALLANAKRARRRGISIYSSGIRHHLLDVVDPKEYFSVAQYQKLALEAIKDIQQRSKLPILCGGTGLYISSVVEGWKLPNVPPNAKLRRELEGLNIEQLSQKLRELDPKRATTIDKNNKHRLIRAIEIATLKGLVPPLIKEMPKWDILILGIKKNKEELKQLIKIRLEKRLKQGMIDEVKKLKKQGITSKRLEDFGLEYHWLNRHLEKKITLLEMKEKLYQDSCHYAKRQMTWFKKIPNVHWISNDEEAIKLISDFLSN